MSISILKNYERILVSPGISTKTVMVHFYTQGGLGDRINFQGLLELKIADTSGYHICAIPYHGDDFDARVYEHKPNEIWIVPEPFPFAYGNPFVIALEVLETARHIFPDTQVHLSLYGSPFIEQRHPQIDEMDPYLVMTTLHRNGEFSARFAPDVSILRSVLKQLAARGMLRQDAPIITFHAPTGHGKYPDWSSMIRLAQELKLSCNSTNVLITNVEVLPDHPRQVFDLVSPNEKGLQVLFALLSASSLFIGGDSGPIHLAACAGIDIVQIRPTSDDWLYGPFCNSSRLCVIEGTETADAGLTFNVDVARSAAVRFVQSARKNVSERGYLEPKGEFSISNMIDIANLFDSKIASLALLNQRHASDLDHTAYLAARGYRLDLFTDDLEHSAQSLELLSRLGSRYHRVIYRLPSGVQRESLEHLTGLTDRYGDQLWLEITPLSVSEDLVSFLRDGGRRHSLLLSVPDELLASKQDAEDRILEGYRFMMESGLIDTARRIRLLSAIPACRADAASLFVSIYRHTGHEMYLFDCLSTYIDTRMKIFSDAGNTCSHYSFYSFNSKEELAGRFAPRLPESCPFDCIRQCNLKIWDYCKIGRTFWMLRESGDKFIRISTDEKGGL